MPDSFHSSEPARNEQLRMSSRAARARKRGFCIVVHDPSPEGLVRFLVFRTVKGSRDWPTLIGSGTRDDARAARAAAERMVARAAGAT